MQLFAKTLLAPFMAGQAIAKVFTRTFMPALVSELAKQAEQQKKQDFVEKVKKDPNILIELIKKAKAKVENQLESIKQKLVEIKKSIAKLTLDINRAKRRIALLSGRAQKLQKELADVRNKIKKLEKVPGKEKELEELKNREKEILKTLSELSKGIILTQLQMKDLEETKRELVTERNELELTERKCQTRLNELDTQKLSSEQALGIVHEHKKPLEQIRERGKEEKAREQMETTQVSYGNFAFRATLDSDYNMHNVQSQKVMPVFGRVGKETPMFMKQKSYDDSIVTRQMVNEKFKREFGIKSPFLMNRLTRSKSYDLLTKSDPSNNKTRGKDEPSL